MLCSVDIPGRGPLFRREWKNSASWIEGSGGHRGGIRGEVAVWFYYREKNKIRILKSFKKA